jgi:hypothetical protein
MEKEFILYEQALALKELGFDEPCIATIDQTEYLYIKGTKKQPRGSMMYDTIDAPLYQQAFRWFREKHNMLTNVYSNASGFLYEYHDTIGGTHRYDSGFTGDCEDSGTFTSFEKAELTCLKKLIEIVKNK